MADNEAAKMNRFSRVPFEIHVQLDRISMRIGDILELKAGSVVALKKPAGDNFDVLVGGTRLGSGEVVLMDNSMAVRLTSLEGE